MSFSAAYHDATKPSRPSSLKGWPVTMRPKSKKEKPSDFLQKPCDESYRLAVKDFNVNVNHLLRILRKKAIPKPYEVVLMLSDLTNSFYYVLRHHAMYYKALTTYENNCKRMDDKK